MAFNLDHTKIKFQVNWASGIVLVGALSWAITVTILNSGYRTMMDSQGVTITAQGKTIDALNVTVATLKGSMETVNSTISAFTDNPPAALEAKIDAVNRLISVYHGNSALGTPIPQPTTFTADSNRMGEIPTIP